jgi:hypothetical protein
MRLTRYLKEADMSLQDIVEILKRDSKPILTQLKKAKRFLWRGRRGIFTAGQLLPVTNDILEVYPRKDRKPAQSHPVDHAAFDRAFKERFGWNVRSEGVFATSKRSEARIYGEPYLFFPVGKYEIVYSPNITDLWREWSMYRYVEWDKFEGKMLKKNPDYGITILQPMFQKAWEEGLVDVAAKKLMKQYKKIGIQKAILSGNEVTFRVKSYYIVNPDFAEDLAKEFGIRWP